MVLGLGLDLDLAELGLAGGVVGVGDGGADEEDEVDNGQDPAQAKGSVLVCSIGMERGEGKATNQTIAPTPAAPP